MGGSADTSPASGVGGDVQTSSGGTTSLPSSDGVAGMTTGAPGLGAAGAITGPSSGGYSGGGSGGASTDAAGVSSGGSQPGGPAPFQLSISVPNVGPGEEGTQCLQTRLPNPTPIGITKLHNVLSQGSHHFIVSAMTASNAAEMPLTPCKPFRAALQGGPLAITQRKDDTVATPAGVAYTLAANQVMSLELHYINTGADTISVQAQTELYPADPGSNLQESSVLLIGTTNINIPAQSAATTGPRYIPMPSALDGVNYFALTGHTHRLGTGVTVASASSATSPTTVLYAPMPFDWDSPQVLSLSPAVQVPTGGGFVLQCNWQNTTDSVITWGESALSEMCFFWAYYYPKKAVSNLILDGFGPVDPSVILALGI